MTLFDRLVFSFCLFLFLLLFTWACIEDYRYNSLDKRVQAYFIDQKELNDLRQQVDDNTQMVQFLTLGLDKAEDHLQVIEKRVDKKIFASKCTLELK